MKKMMMSKSKGKKKKAPGPMDLEEIEEAHNNVSKLTNVDLAGAGNMSAMYDDSKIDLQDFAGPSKLTVKSEGTEDGPKKMPMMKKKAPQSSSRVITSPKIVSKKANIREVLGRDDLIDTSRQLDFYPLQHVKTIVSKIKAKNSSTVDIVLDFTGVEQLSDLAFYLLNTSQEDLLKKVVGINLTGCLHVTDQGIIWMASAFTGLKAVSLIGCRHVTETGLYHLMKQCKSLEEINLVGTSVSILPKDIIKYTVNLDGCPLISPEKEIFNRGGFKLLQEELAAPSYPKPQDEDVVKLCIINGSGSTKSLIKHLKKEFENKLEPLVVEYNFKARSNFTANIVECDETLCDLFITKRTLYLLPVQVASDEAKSEAKRLFGLMCYIIAKVHNAAFIVIGVSDNGDKTCSSAELKAELTNLISTGKSSLTKELQKLKLTEALPSFGFLEQESWKGKCILSRALENLFIEYCDVNMRQSYKEADPLQTSIIKGMKAVIEIYPEFQEIAQPVFAYTLSDSVQKILKDGVLSMETAKQTNFKMMELMAIMGKTVCTSVVQDVPIVLLNSWLAKVMSVAFNPPPDVLNGGKVFGAGDDTPVWLLDPFKKALEKVTGPEQATSGVKVLFKLGLSIHRSVFLSYKALNSQPVVPVDQFFPELSNGKEQQLFSSVYYRLAFDFILPNFVIHKLMWLCSQLKRPSQAWQSGFILQEACVETLFEIVKKDNGSYLNFCVHMMKLDGTNAPGDTQAVNQMVWTTVEQYRIILDYVLEKAAFPYTCKLLTGTRPPAGEVSGLISYHVWKSVQEEVESSDTMLACHLCGVQSPVASFPWGLYNETNHSCWDKDFLKWKEADTDLQLTGNIVNFTNKGKCFLMTPLEVTEQNCCKFTFLDGSAAAARVSIGFSLMENKKTFAFVQEIQLDLSNGNVVMKKSGNDSKIGDVSPTSLPRLGESLSLQLREIPGDLKSCELRFYRDNEIIGKFLIPKHRYLPSLEVGETKSSSENKVSVMIHPLMKDAIKKNTELHVGMRLEALDRKNPHLICVATIEDITDDGKVKIHFDGWNSGSYDYYTDFSSNDLHPVGWCSKNMAKHNNLRQELQAPKGWSGEFLWPQYCVGEKSYPVPNELFSEAQIGVPSSVEEDCLSALEGSGLDVPMSNTVHSRCRTTKHRPKMFEYKALARCSMSPALFDFFSNNSKFLCFLPANFDVNTLRYPSMNALMNFQKQNVHVLCPGLKMELLHFVDYKGTSLQHYSVSEYAAYLQNCYIGLLIQEGNILPENCTDLIPGITLTQSMSGQLDLWMKRLCFLNVCVLEYIQYVSGSKGASFRDLVGVFKDVMKDNKPRLLFQQTETYVRCTGHVLSSMASNELNAVPMEKYSQFYPFIQKLDFQNNFIERLPNNFFECFVNLEYLCVANNQLVTLPNGLEKVKNLSYLDISMNNILELPENFNVLAESLIHLNISDNPLSTLPKVVYELTKLEELYADNVGSIGTGFSEIKNLTELITLSLARNEIRHVPDELGDLSLAYLDLSGVPWFEQLTLTKTFLSYRAFNQTLNGNYMTNRITEKERQELFKQVDADESSTLTADEVLELNDVLCKKYHRFGAGTLEYPETGGIPSPILKLKKLKTLILKNHLLKFIPDEIKALTALKEMDLSFSPQITSLTAELSGLPMKMIHLQECPLLKTPPKEIVARGFVAVMGYLKRLRLGASPCKRTKLMLVGLGGAGKTSLVSALMNSRYRAYMDHDEAITDGIDISKWQVPIKDEKDPLTFSVWDFAGQTVYYNTHQFFLSNRAVYLLLWNVRQGYEHAGLDFWLSSIACHAPKAPILVVGTHSDKVEKCRLPEASLQARFPQITGFFYVSSYTGDGIPNLKKSIVNVALQQKYMGEKIPEAWLNLEKKLIKLREEQEKDFLLLTQLDAIAQSIGIFDRNELIQAIQFLHDLGAAQFFDTDFLRSIVVIYPQWIVDVMACLVTVHQGVVKDGRLELKDISGVWQDYPSELHPWLLRLTEEFDLTCPLPNKETSIVPCLLPDAEPKYDWPHADPEKNIKESLTIYKFQYLPAGLFNRAQARLHQYSEGTLLWKKGSFLNKNDHKAVLLQTDNSEVIVRAQGFRPDNFLFLVHELIETLIAESYAGVHYDFLVPCLECLNMNVKDPSMVSYIKVQRALELNAPFLQCDKFFHILSIAELRDSMPSDKVSEIDNHLRTSVRELIDLESETTINVFFVYSTKNVPGLENENKMVHPGTVMEDLRKHNDLKLSFTDKPETSDMEGITLSVKGADVVIIGMSDEFCEDSECSKLLLYIKDVLRKPVLLLLLGKTKNWQKGDLNMVFGSEVYVDMQKIERYPHKIEELYTAIKKKAATSSKAKSEDVPQCFISYCWSNSHDAIAKGSRHVTGALGWEGGDPRAVKNFLESKGIHCWLDIERVGGTGLFHSIADGLREAKIMLAFVSDEYVKSKNCIMEFRYALTTLRIPVIVIVVGTGYTWERSEVGLLVVGHSCTKINFQFANETGHLELLKLVQEKLPDIGTSQNSKATEENQRNVAFQEVLELTQRKFLRHMTKSVSSVESEPYPRLIVIDFVTEKERKERIEELKKHAEITKKKTTQGTVREKEKSEAQDSKSEDKGENSETGCSESENLEEAKRADSEATQQTEEGETLKEIGVKSKYCFRLLCEYDQNWHESSSPIFFPDLEPGDEQAIIDSAAPYLGRVYAIMKHGKSQMESLNTPEGEKFQQKIEEICMKSGTDFYQEYLELRTLVMQQDKAMVKGQLQRCQVNGKTVWLCQKHKNASRSETEQRFQNQFAQKTAEIPLPTGELPEHLVPPEPIEIVNPEEEAAPRQQHRKIFKKSSESVPKLQRQTSQMCSIS